MRLTFLGTAGAEGYPSAFCRCDNCERARALGGPSLRKRSSALVNDDLLIDLGPDIAVATAQHGRPLTGVRYCLQTHAHADHFDPLHLLARGWGLVGAPRLHLYASPASLRQMAWHLHGEFDFGYLLDPTVAERLNLAVHPVEPDQTFAVGLYRVTAVAASHDPSQEPLLYAIVGGGRSIFYGTDTGPLPEQSWQALRQRGLRFDVAILDHTYGDGPERRDHLTGGQFVSQVARLRQEGLLADGARVFAHHIAHGGNPAHPELVALAATRGYEVAYDGLTV